MYSLEARIVLATLRVNESRLVVEQQRALIREGHAVPNAVQLLQVFEGSLAVLETGLRVLLAERDGKCGNKSSEARHTSPSGQGRLVELMRVLCNSSYGQQ